MKVFYKSEKENKLTLDRSAQELTRSDYVDYDLIVYLIELNEKRLVSFDHLIRLYLHGRKFIIYTPTKEVTSLSFELKIKKGRTVKRQLSLWSLTYVVSAFMFLAPFIFSLEKYHTLLDEQFNIIVAIYVCAYFIGTAIFAVSSLLNTTDLKDAEMFINELKNAELRMSDVQDGTTEIKLVTNERMYFR